MRVGGDKSKIEIRIPKGVNRVRIVNSLKIERGTNKFEKVFPSYLALISFYSFK